MPDEAGDQDVAAGQAAISGHFLQLRRGVAPARGRPSRPDTLEVRWSGRWCAPGSCTTAGRAAAGLAGGLGGDLVRRGDAQGGAGQSFSAAPPRPAEPGGCRAPGTAAQPGVAEAIRPPSSGAGRRVRSGARPMGTPSGGPGRPMFSSPGCPELALEQLQDLLGGPGSSAEGCSTPPARRAAPPPLAVLSGEGTTVMKSSTITFIRQADRLARSSSITKVTSGPDFRPEVNGRERPQSCSPLSAGQRRSGLTPPRAPASCAATGLQALTKPQSAGGSLRPAEEAAPRPSSPATLSSAMSPPSIGT